MRALLVSALGAGLAWRLVACGDRQGPAPAHCAGPAAVAATGPDGTTVIGYVASGRVVRGEVWLLPLVDDIAVWPVKGDRRGRQPDALLVRHQPPVRLAGCEENGSYRIYWPACEGEWGLGIIDPVDPRTGKAVVRVSRVTASPTAEPQPHKHGAFPASC